MPENVVALSQIAGVVARVIRNVVFDQIGRTEAADGKNVDVGYVVRSDIELIAVAAGSKAGL